MEHLPSEILVHIFSFHQFTIQPLGGGGEGNISEFCDDQEQCTTSNTTKTLFNCLLNLTDETALTIYKGNPLSNNVEEHSSDPYHQILNKLFNYYDPSSYNKESYLLYQRYSNEECSIINEWFESDDNGTDRRHNIEIMFTTAESSWSNSGERYLDQLYMLFECVRDAKKYSQRYHRALMNLLMLNQTFGVGFLGQWIVKYIDHYPSVYVNLKLVSKKWKEAAEHPILWEVSSGMLQCFLKLRSELEFIRLKLFPKMETQLDMNADENNCYILMNANDSGLKRFQVDENCNIKPRFPILSRYCTLLEKKVKGIPKLIQQAKSDIIENKSSDDIFDHSYQSFLDIKSLQMKENHSKSRKQKIGYFFNNFMDRICCSPFMKKLFFITLICIMVFLMYDMIGIVGDGLNNRSFTNETLITNQTTTIDNTKNNHINTDSLLRDLTLMSVMIFSILMLFTGMTKAYMIPITLQKFSITISNSFIQPNHIVIVIFLVEMTLVLQYFTYLISGVIQPSNLLELFPLFNFFILLLLIILSLGGIFYTYTLLKRVYLLLNSSIWNLQRKFTEEEYSLTIGAFVILLRFCVIPMSAILFCILFSLTISLNIYSYWPLVISIWLIQIIVQFIAIYEFIWIRKEKKNKLYHTEIMIPVSDRRQMGEYDDDLIIKRGVEYPYESFTIQLLILLGNILLFICGIHLLTTERVEKWLWSSPFFIFGLCGCYYIVMYMHFLTGHNHTILYKEYKEKLKTHKHPLFNIYIDNEGSLKERIVCRLKTSQEEQIDLNQPNDQSDVQEEPITEIEMNEIDTISDNVQLL